MVQNLQRVILSSDAAKFGFTGGNQAGQDARHSSIQLRSGGQGRWDCSLLVLISFGGLSVGGGSLRGKSLVLFFDLRELAHILKEVGASLESNEQLGLLTAFSAVPGTLTLAGDWNRHGADGLEDGVFVPAESVSKSLGSQSSKGKEARKKDSKVYLPYEVLGGNDAGGNGVAKSVQLDSLMDFEVALSEEHVEVGVFLDRDVDLTRVFRTRIGRLLRGILL